jgi:hypothetical protein
MTSASALTRPRASVDSELDAVFSGRALAAAVCWDAAGEEVILLAGTSSWRVTRTFLHLALVSPASDGTTTSRVEGHVLFLTSAAGTLELQRGPVLAYLGSTLAVRSLVSA